MMNLTMPVADDCANYRYVAEYRRDKRNPSEPRAAVLEPEVLRLYGRYADRVLASGAPTPHGFTIEDHRTLTENEKCLTHKVFDPLTSAILGSAKARKCPYCLLGNVSEIDHYLPKTIFGEYSIYSSNLIPSCRRCNGRKLNRFMREDGGRRFLHPYLDHIHGENEEFVVATVSVGASVMVNFRIVRPPKMTDEVWRILLSHFEDLQLAVRYMEEAVEAMASMLAALYTYFERGGKARVADYLNIEQRSKEAIYGRNHWWPVTLKTLASSDEFCDGGFMVLGGDPGLPAY